MTVIDRERFGSGTLPIWVRHEHQARWRFAAGFAAGKVIADCACGIGAGTAMFAQAGAARVHAFDLSPDAVEAARHRCQGYASVTVQQADGRNLPLADRSIDLFVSFETIEHINDDRAFLTQVCRVLRDDGTFICSTPNRQVTMPGKRLADAPWNPFHVREYGQNEFQGLLEEHFACVRLHGQNPKSAWRVAMLEGLGRKLPGHLGGRINSGLKLPRLIFDREADHRVTSIPDNGTCEYLVAVCTGPRSP